MPGAGNTPTNRGAGSESLHNQEVARRRDVRKRLEAAVDGAAAEAGFALDRGQRVVLERLLDLGADLSAPRLRRPGTPSLYVWGDAGRGKSWLLDAFFRVLPAEAKLRVHFHGFLDQLHRRIHELSGEANAVQRAVRQLTGGIGLLYFDEFHVHDPADATLLTRLLRELFEANIILLASSNYAPGSLLPDPQWHHIFEPGIDLILENMEVLRLEGPEDYRSRPREPAPGFRAGRWISPNSDDRLAAAGFRRPNPAEAVELTVGSRRFPVAARRGNELWITFDQLCAGPTSTIEYLDWARQFDHWVVLDVPSFADADAQAQQRLINAVDVLCDADVRTTVASPLTIDEFRLSGDDRPDAFRLMSRMQLLRNS